MAFPDAENNRHEMAYFASTLKDRIFPSAYGLLCLLLNKVNREAGRPFHRTKVTGREIVKARRQIRHLH